MRVGAVFAIVRPPLRIYIHVKRSELRQKLMLFVLTLQQRDSIVQQNTHSIFRICRRRGRKRWMNSSSSSAVFDERAICRVVSTPEPDPPTATASTGVPCTLGVSYQYIPLLPLAGDSRCHLPLFVMPCFLTHPTLGEEGNLLPDVSRRG